MVVWVVEGYDYDSSWILEIFADEEDARKYMANEIATNGTACGYRCTSYRVNSKSIGV